MVGRGGLLDRRSAGPRARGVGPGDRHLGPDALLGLPRPERARDPPRAALVGREDHRGVRRDHPEGRRRGAAPRLGEQSRARGIHPPQGPLAPAPRARGVRAARDGAPRQGLHPIPADRRARHRAFGRLRHVDVRSGPAPLERRAARRRRGAALAPPRRGRIGGSARSRAAPASWSTTSSTRAAPW